MTTQNCAECGTRAEPGQSFCDACGAVLSWTTDQAGATPARDEAAERSADGGSGQAPPRQAAGPTATTTGAPIPAPVPPENDTDTDTDGTIQMRAVTPEDEMSDRARSLVVPVADPADPAAPPTVSPVLPARPAATRPPTQAVSKEPDAADGVPCPWCATANRPDRHYCARCAMPMVRDEQAAPGRRPWWRRILDHRNRETPWAGERPRLRRTFEHILRWLGVAIVLTLLILLAIDIPDGVRATRDHFAERAPVDPDSYRASNSFPDHSARRVFDKRNDTWWGPGVTESAEGEWVEARFEQPTRLLDLVITPGVSTRADELDESALPHRIEARITTEDGTTTTRELTLDQGPGAQVRDFRAEGVTSVRFTLVSAYGADPDKQVAIAEIEFFGPSSGSIL